MARPRRTQVKNEVGTQYGSLKVLVRARRPSSKRVYWICECVCGLTTTVRGETLRSGKPVRGHQDCAERVGSVNGKITVLGRGLRDGRHKRWICACECGEVLTVTTSNLSRTRSCGCTRGESLKGVWRVPAEEVHYLLIHQRVRAVRGRASLHPCTDCGGMAREWSYEGGCPQERVEAVRHRNGSVSDMAFCVHLDCYSPRCRRCHNAHDHPDWGLHASERNA